MIDTENKQNTSDTQQVVSQEDKKEEQLPEEGVLMVDGESADQEVVLEMAKAGVLYGHRKFRKNPQFEEYVFTTRNSVEVIDLVKTLGAIDVVAEFLKKSMTEQKKFLVVATQPAAHQAAQKISAALGNCPYVAEKWVGGTLTNFPIISKRINEFKRLKQGMETKSFDKYTKKEKLEISREIERMEKKFGSVQNIEGIPDIMFVVDSSIKGHRTAMREARRKGMKLVGIIDNDDNPKDFDYFIPANDHAQASIEWVVGRVIEVMSK